MGRSIIVLQAETRRRLLMGFYVVIMLVASMVPRSSCVPVVRSNQKSANIAPLIIDGEPTSRCQWPWMTALMTTERRFVCGATLISPEWLLTAAHCVYNYPGQLHAAIGAYNLTAQDEVFNIPIKDIIIEDGYNPSSYGVNDIALLRLATRLELNSSDCLEAISLPQPDYNAVENTNCSIIGWGRTDYDVETGISEVLTQKKAIVITNDVCQLRWQKSMFGTYTIYPENVCIDEKQNVSACQGDSGSPMQCYVSGRGWTIVGVSSWGSNSCKWYPSVFMRVSSYDRWILSAIALAPAPSTIATITDDDTSYGSSTVPT